ncbi:MAG: translation initiation factor IF-2 [Bacteroidales bacterium]|nr:translation initiation factor IF-2 [Bacteroidales bacterium]
MTKDKKVKRLSKLAREFNVGISTIVDFLKKKGYDIDPNPNAKVTPDQYDILVKEYSTDIDVKKESQRINLNYDERSSVSINDIEKENEEGESEDKDEEILIKDVSGSSSEADQEEAETTTREPEEKEEEPGEEAKEKEKEPSGKEEEAEREEPAEEETREKKSPKVLGKIDLETEKKKKAKPEEKEEAPAEEPQPTDAKQEEEKPEAEEKEVEQPVEETPSGAKGEEEIEDKEAEQEEPPEEKAVETEAAAEEDEEEGADAVEDEGEALQEEEEPDEEESIKVVGKIDLDSLNQKTRPDRKSRKEREAERQKKAPEAPKKTPEGQKKKEGAAQQGDKDTEEKPKRKRRKRIHKDKERVQLENKKKAAAEQKKSSRKKKKKRPVRNEINEEDVQKQIKETLSRLEGKGKSKSAKYRREKRQAITQKQKEEEEKVEQERNVLKVTEFVSVKELASMMDESVNDVIQTCMNLGLLVSINQRLDAETMALVADEYNYKVEFVSVDVQEAIKEEEDDEKDLEPRDPIATVMGHVDHGKTSLLDHIRKTNVIGGEAGGITQHIGAYRVKVGDGRQITFLDTPGHEAFTAMRARGAQVTDIAIIVVAADDNIMPQTVEAINHASAAGVPIVFAINKIDKAGASPERLKEELANMNYLVEDWGGKYQSQDISAKQGENIKELLEKVLLEADVQELKANPNKPAHGTVIESWLDHGRGYISNVLVQAGTLKVGDVILAGSHMGRVKAMYNELGKEVNDVGPSQPVQLLGLNGAPQAGDKFNVMAAEKEAKEIATRRSQLEREQSMRTQKHITLDEIGRRIAIGNFQEVNLVVKGDVDGSIEALSDAFSKLSSEELQVNIIHKGIGQITESDILLAAASNAIIIGFQVRPSTSARKLAQKEQIDIRLYSVIYDAINDMKDALEGMLIPEMKEEITGSAEVKETFKIKKTGTVAGCIVRDGKLERNNKVRVIRDGIVIYTGELESLKRYKDDVKEVREGYECGLNVKNYNDIKVGDNIEGFKEVEVKKSLNK